MCTIVCVSVSAYKCVFEFVCGCLCTCNTVQLCECASEGMYKCVYVSVYVNV